jgi:hypothetical protein
MSQSEHGDMSYRYQELPQNRIRVLRFDIPEDGYGALPDDLVCTTRRVQIIYPTPAHASTRRYAQMDRSNVPTA